MSRGRAAVLKNVKFPCVYGKQFMGKPLRSYPSVRNQDTMSAVWSVKCAAAAVEWSLLGIIIWQLRSEIGSLPLIC